MNWLCVGMARPIFIYMYINTRYINSIFWLGITKYMVNYDGVYIRFRPNVFVCNAQADARLKWFGLPAVLRENTEFVREYCNEWQSLTYSHT